MLLEERMKILYEKDVEKVCDRHRAGIKKMVGEKEAEDAVRKLGMLMMRKRTLRGSKTDLYSLRKPS